MSSFDDVILEREDMHGYQNVGVDFMYLNPYSAMFIDMGLGKTVTTLTLIHDLVCNFEVDNVLIVGPLRVANETWPTEIRLWRHTAAMKMVQIRDQDLVDRINKAGAHARKVLTTHGAQHPEVAEFIREYRTIKLRKLAKKKGHVKHDIVRYAKANIDKAMLREATSDELKMFSTYARQKEAARAVREHKKANPATIYVINREQLEFLVTAWGRDWPYDCVIVDESSCLKDHRTKRWAALRKVRPLIKRFHQLTATPASESYQHLFGQIGLLDLGERLGNTFTKFTSDYFDHNKYTHKYTLRDGCQELIVNKISDLCLVMKAEDHLPTEAPIDVMHELNMGAKARAIYDSMETDSLVELDGRVIEAETAAALSSKLLQISSGVLYETYFLEDIDQGDEDEIPDMVKVKKVHHVHDAKIDHLKSIVDEYEGEPIMVAYHFKSSLDRLQKAFPKAVVMDRAGTAVKPWNAGKIPMLLVHPQSAGHGLNLQRGGRHLAFFDLPWSLELYLQVIGRLARQGQTQTVFLHHLICKNTLDEVVLSCLKEKRSVQDGLFKLLKARRAQLS